MKIKLLAREDRHFFLAIVLLNLSLMFLRIRIGDPAKFSGNIPSMLVLSIIFCWLGYFIITNKYDRFIVLWLSFYFAAPILKIPFISIGSLGLLNAVFIPFMLLKSFNIRNKYIVIIIISVVLGLFNTADIGLRLFFSRMVNFIALPVFFYFVMRKSKKPSNIMGMAVLVALINIPFAIYQFLAVPDWGVFIDWRGTRVFGNLFWPNSYALYLIPPILYLYHTLRRQFTKGNLLMLIALMVGFLMSYSRTGFVVLFVSIIILELSNNVRILVKPKFYITLISVFLLLFFFVTFYADDPRLSLDALSERTSIWQSIYPYMSDNLLLGNGVGSYEVFRNNFIYGLSSHNYYINILFETGVTGLILIVALFWFMLKDIHGIKDASQLAPFGYSLVAVLVINSLVSDSPFSQVVALNLWVMLACVIRKKNE